MTLARRVGWQLFAGLLVLAHVASHLHLGLAQHGVCVEHGEVVEARSEERRARDRLDGVETHFDDNQTGGEASDHEHCLAAQAARNRLPVFERVIVWAERPEIHLFAPRERPFVPVPLERLHLAPKQSPPAA